MFFLFYKKCCYCRLSLYFPIFPPLCLSICLYVCLFVCFCICPLVCPCFNTCALHRKLYVCLFVCFSIFPLVCLVLIHVPSTDNSLASWYSKTVLFIDRTVSRTIWPCLLLSQPFQSRTGFKTDHLKYSRKNRIQNRPSRKNRFQIKPSWKNRIWPSKKLF